MATITIQLDAATHEQLAELAEARHQPIADVAAEVISMNFAPPNPGMPSANKSIDEMTLEELLEGVEDGMSLGEYDWGPPRGAEV